MIASKYQIKLILIYKIINKLIQFNKILIKINPRFKTFKKRCKILKISKKEKKNYQQFKKKTQVLVKVVLLKRKVHYQQMKLIKRMK